MTVAKIAPGLGNPLLLTMKQFAGICEALSEQTADEEVGDDHRAHVEREMERIKNGHRTAHR